jgi:hypothetical protein
MLPIQSRYVTHALTGLLCLALLSGCAKKITEHSLPFKNIMPTEDRHPLQLAGGGAGRDSLNILYLGCGHLVLQFKNESIVLDPYFSIQSFTPGKKIQYNKADSLQWAKTLKRHHVDLKKTKSVWLSHSHYDHTMDLPLMMENHFTDSVKIFGSDDGTHTFTNFQNIISHYQVLNKHQVYVPDRATVPPFIKTGKTIEVLPIRSDHAPHARVLGIPIHLMKGYVKKKYFEKHYDDLGDRTKKKQWREGETFSFLIDFKTGATIDYRVFVQTSASHFPLAKPPKALLEQRPVDLALLCLASSNYAQPYPVEIIKYLDQFSSPNYVFIHWEDFFTRGSFNHYKLVRLTNFRKIHKRLTKKEISLDPATDVMPQPGTMIVVK